jgi:hypothetical protein
MARQLSTDAITKQDIVDYLRTNDDFHLELEVYNACVRAGLTAVLGGTYEDPATRLSRQFDIRAKALKGQLQIRLAVECKCLKTNFPLVISRVPRSAPDSFHDIIVSASGAHSVRLNEAHTIYRASEYVGKSITQIGRHGTTKELITGDSEVYDKWSQALASSHAFIHSAPRAYEKLEMSHALVAVLPFVVLPDHTLWTVDYAIDGTQQSDPKQTTDVTVYVGRQYPFPVSGQSFTISHLHFLTLSAFFGFLKQLNEGADFWNALFPMKQIQAQVDKAQLGLRSA